MKNQISFLVASALCACVTLTTHDALARGRHGPADESSVRGDGATDSDKAGRRAMKERARQKLQAHVHEELVARVGLSDEKARALSEVMKRRGQEREAQGQRMRQEMKQLHGLVKSEASDAELRAQMERIARLRQEKREDAQGLMEETASFLSPREQARMMLAFPKVMRETRKLIRESRRGGRHGHGDHAAHDEDLDD